MRPHRKCLIALGIRTARDLDIDRLILEIRPGDEVQDDVLPFRRTVRVGQTNPVERGLEAAQVFIEAERSARIDRNDLVTAVTEQEPRSSGDIFASASGKYWPLRKAVIPVAFS